MEVEMAGSVGGWKCGWMEVEVWAAGRWKCSCGCAVVDRYYEVTMTTEETVEQEETTYVKVAAGSGGEVSGSRWSQSVDAEQLTSMSHEESTRFVIRGVIDPQSGDEISMDQVTFCLAVHNVPYSGPIC